MSAAAKVGIFMLVVLAILGFFILKIEDIRIDRSTGTKTIRARFESAAGLEKKSAVRVAGVRVGKVTDIQLTDDGKADVTIEIDKDVRLHENASATIANLGLLGEKYLELNPGTQTAPMLREGENVVLRGSHPPTIDDVTGQVSDIATDVKAMTESLRKAMSGPQGEQRISEIFDNVHRVTAQMRMILENNRGNIDATAANFRKITDDLRIEIPKIAASIERVASSFGGTISENRGDVRVVVENLRSLSSDLRVTADHLNDITGKVKSGEGSIGKLIYSDEAHSKLTSALTSVESGVTELKNTLGRANRIAMDVGIRSDFYAGLDPVVADQGFDGNSRSVVSVKLIPNPERNRFYNVELSDDPRGDRKEKILTTTTTDASGVSSTVTTRELKYERDFLISAQAGWQLDDWRLRVGLFDSAGGIGVDWDKGERLRVTGEAYDFGGRRDDNAHLRVFGQYVIRKEKENFPQLFVSSGIDNALNDVAFTFGGGIRWRDDDLKYLIGSVPIGK